MSEQGETLAKLSKSQKKKKAAQKKKVGLSAMTRTVALITWIHAHVLRSLRRKPTRQMRNRRLPRGRSAVTMSLMHERYWVAQYSSVHIAHPKTFALGGAISRQGHASAGFSNV
jgi:hypothetical protein